VTPLMVNVSVAYSYQLAACDPVSGRVAFALTTAPTGTTVTGNTVNWTPAYARHAPRRQLLRDDRQLVAALRSPGQSIRRAPSLSVG
jgi:hypothetical protein